MRHISLKSQLPKKLAQTPSLGSVRHGIVDYLIHVSQLQQFWRHYLHLVLLHIIHHPHARPDRHRSLQHMLPRRRQSPKQHHPRRSLRIQSHFLAHRSRLSRDRSFLGPSWTFRRINFPSWRHKFECVPRHDFFEACLGIH